MTLHHKLYAALASFMGVALVLSAADAHAQSSPLGVWLDHTGRGAVEISPCGEALCGRVVWVKSADDAKGCGRQIIGDAKPVGKSGAHNGWIYSPEKRRRYDVEFKTTPDGRLKVVGYAGTKLFSRTMMWKRPVNDLPRCDASRTTVRTATPASPAAPAAAPSAQQGPASTGGIAPAAKTEKPAAATTAAVPASKSAPVSSEVPAPQETPQSAQAATGERGGTSAAGAVGGEDEGAGGDQAGDGAEDARGGDEPGARLAEILDKVVTRGANGDCKLDLPWVKVRFRCDGD